MSKNIKAEDILIQETPFSQSLPKKEKFVFATYMKYPQLTRQKLADKTAEEWGIKVSKSTVDALFARDGMEDEFNARYEALISGPEIVAVTCKMIEVAKTSEGFQDRKLLLTCAGKLKKGEQSEININGVGDITMEFPVDKRPAVIDGDIEAGEV